MRAVIPGPIIHPHHPDADIIPKHGCPDDVVTYVSARDHVSLHTPPSVRFSNDGTPDWFSCERDTHTVTLHPAPFIHASSFSSSGVHVAKQCVP
mmetsp:Transcript_7274/g.14156  ORF Transcript_7274/g.14156 Transcript_7274/m.14156 type:complete len:94 (-) Transcript_7274:70-351(-)